MSVTREFLEAKAAGHRQALEQARAAAAAAARQVDLFDGAVQAVEQILASLPPAEGTETQTEQP